MRMHVQIHACACVCARMCACVCGLACKHARVFVSVRVCMHVRVCRCDVVHLMCNLRTLQICACAEIRLDVNKWVHARAYVYGCQLGALQHGVGVSGPTP